jgi:hypothetical protein
MLGAQSGSGSAGCSDGGKRRWRAEICPVAWRRGGSWARDRAASGERAQRRWRAAEGAAEGGVFCSSGEGEFGDVCLDGCRSDDRIEEGQESAVSDVCDGTVQVVAWVGWLHRPRIKEGKNRLSLRGISLSGVCLITPKRGLLIPPRYIIFSFHHARAKYIEHVASYLILLPPSS